MKFTVRWGRAALSQLAEIWLQHPSERDAINRAADGIDRRLSVDPAQQGESRDQGRRVLFAPPLAAFFRVDENSRTVRVLAIRGMRLRGGS